jgi:mRNA-degrading endonuclease YafQ of YafQ-DinJ toxin-antitoxin module
VIDIIWGPRFKRTYKKKLRHYPEIKQRLFAALKLFVKDPFHPTLKTHKLEGPLKGNYAFSLGYDLRIVFKFVEAVPSVVES